MTTDENDLRRGAAAPAKPGTLTMSGRAQRLAPAILIRARNAERPEDGTEVIFLGVDGVYLDAALERIRAKLERYAAATGREIQIAPVGHPDAPCGYAALGLLEYDMNRAIGGAGVLTPTDAEGRW